MQGYENDELGKGEVNWSLIPSARWFVVTENSCIASETTQSEIFTDIQKNNFNFIQHFGTFLSGAHKL